MVKKSCEFVNGYDLWCLLKSLEKMFSSWQVFYKKIVPQLELEEKIYNQFKIICIGILLSVSWIVTQIISIWIF